ncbi:hypothetical protein [Bdellovibrio sp. HCB288]|uniref:hypothetical protein n=1 Tax=Bdellovibrio sp. HCB288 TaxID=3394355 RepID=UPI0039B41B91
MNSRWLKIIFAILTIVSIYTVEASASICEPPRGSKLARDQRDNWRSNCLKKKKAELTPNQCLAVAKSMEYSNNAEEARLVCLYDLKKLTLKDCATIAKQMEYADSGDETKWHCLREYSSTISKKQCETLAKSMAYPPNSDRAQLFCENELN